MTTKPVLLSGSPMRIRLHDYRRYANLVKYCGSAKVSLQDCLLEFTLGEIRRARFSMNQGTGPRCLRMALLQNGETNYYFLSESLEDIRALCGFDLQFKEKWDD